MSSPSFIKIMTKIDRNGYTHVFPEYTTRGKDIMIKGKTLFAAYDDKSGMWLTNDDDIIDLIDGKLEEYVAEKYGDRSENVVIDYLHLSGTKMLKAFREWVASVDQNHNYRQLDNDITFINDEVTMKDYRSKRLPYVVGPGDISAYDEFVSTCYTPSEREKLEWAIGSVFCGDAKKIQKFFVVYGKPGTGKSTMFDLIDMLFEGYTATINVDALVSKSDQFGTAVLKDNPLVCIQHDADLSRIEKNDVLNSIVSHEKTMINEKHKPLYPIKPSAMIFIGTNEVVSVSDTKQGIVRRMIDVYPSGLTLPTSRYNAVKKRIPFELGAIAQHCIDVYTRVCEEDPDRYLRYKPNTMIKKSNIYTQFVSDRFFDLCDPMNDPITVRELYKMFKEYVEESGYARPPVLAKFKEVMLDFYDSYEDRIQLDGKRYRSVFVGFKQDSVDDIMSCVADKTVDDDSVDDAGKKHKFVFVEVYKDNVLDRFLSSMPAQLSNKYGVPSVPWAKCKTKLKDISTSEEHYVKVPENLIVIDFDLKNPDGTKSKERNLEAIESWPLTYAEFSKSGGGIHLHYLYDGDVNALSRVYDDNIEVKVYTGDSALRRKLTECVNAPIAHLSSGLPLREVNNTLKFESLKNEKSLRTLIKKNLNKEYHANTKPSIDFIFDALESAYYSGMKYDVSDLQQKIIVFASQSTNNAAYCIKKVNMMHFKSDEPNEPLEMDMPGRGIDGDVDICFFDIEIFPNLMILCWSRISDGDNVYSMVNPSVMEIESFLKMPLAGFNNRKYDNHILYARMLGYNNDELYRLSQRLVDDESTKHLAATFSEAYNLSYLDVYDMSTDKKSLKKWEIELGIHHLENAHPWNERLAERYWDEVTEYCKNDVRATKKVFEVCQGDFFARKILADLSGLTVNHSTRQHATKIIFGDDKKPELVYVDLSKEFPGYEFDQFGIPPEKFNGYDPNDKKTWKVGQKSIYMGEAPSEGGDVAYIPGIYYHVGLFDIASMHPSTMRALNIFGKYTKNFTDLVDARIAIKHKDFGTARKLLDGKLAKYLQDETMADQLAQALKIVINSVYGYTTAKFDNPFKDPRNKDNIVAKRGALFMIKLRSELEKMGVAWAHVKTDSIKIPNVTDEIKEFIFEFGKKYGYTFELESTYEKMCLINGSTYIAYVESGKHANQWVAVATQFKRPYVFKTLFSHEPIEFDDLCETKEVKTSMVLDFNEGLPEDEHNYQYVGKIGRYVPVKEGCGGGILLRDKGEEQYQKELANWSPTYGENLSPPNRKPCPPPKRYVSVVGTVGYRWIDAEKLKDLPKEEIDRMVDKSYFAKLVDDAIAAVNEYGDFEQFMGYRTGDVYPMDEPSPFPDE